MPIPKLVHLTWKTKKIPDQFKKSVVSWMRTNPDWELRLWTDADNRDYIKTKYPDFLATYDGYPHNIQRADAIRYFLLRDFGGVYSDMDIEILGSLTSFFENLRGEVFLVQSGNVSVFTNSFMASEPGAAFWDEVIDRLMNPVIPWFCLTKHFVVMYSTGPLMLNDVAKKTNQVIGILPRNIFMPYSISDDLYMIKPGAMLRNLNEGSWNSLDSMLLNFIFRHGISIGFFLLSLVAITIYWKRSLHKTIHVKLG